MKILIVASYNKGRFAPFITEQVVVLQQQGCEVECFGIVGKGIVGYLRALSKLRKKIIDFQPDIVHAHYGLTGLLCCLQRMVPVVVTYHGSDINNARIRILSKVAMRLAVWNVFVSKRSALLAAYTKSNAILLPCGVDLTQDQCLPKSDARRVLGWDSTEKVVLFAGAFDNAVKNYPLAQASIDEYNRLNKEQCRLVELKGYSRSEVTLLMCAADCLLLTSHTEGSPQVVKEAMACGCPIVSVDVGDVSERLDGLQGCYIVPTYQSSDVAHQLQNALQFTTRTKGRERIRELGLDNRYIAMKLMDIYNKVCKHA